MVGANFRLKCFKKVPKSIVELLMELKMGPIDTIIHIWYCWIRRCGYMPNKNYLELMRFVNPNFKILHFDGIGYYIKHFKKDVEFYAWQKIQIGSFKKPKTKVKK